MQVSRTRYISTVAILSAISFGLMYLDFAIPSVMPSFVKMDFSELPALIGSFALGPIAGVIICFVKNLIHLSITTTGGVGELCNFLLGAVFVATAGIIYKHKKTRLWALIACIAGSIAMAVLSYPINLWITYPFYYKFMPKEAIIGAYKAILGFVDSIEVALLVFNTPFNIVKCLLVSTITFLVYKPLSYVIKSYHFGGNDKKKILEKEETKEEVPQTTEN